MENTLCNHETLSKTETAKTEVSGYSLYNPIIKQRERKNTLLVDGYPYPPLPSMKYDIIYADPPWHYNGKVQFDKSLVKKENPHYQKHIFVSSASFKYPTVKTQELAKIPVHTISEDNCLLFLWTTNPHLAQAIELGRAWGFEYKTVAFVWHKHNHNPGQYTLSYCELCLLFKKGKIPGPRGARNVKQFLRAPRTEHSKKPGEVARNITKMFPTQKKIELFARQRFDNWDAWGLEI
ncbi:MAG: MT-A70 family methyltransferase [Salinispira sp.]